MNYFRIPFGAMLGIALVSLLSAASVGAQTQSTALERGYRTGYSDGYNAGFKDSADKAARDYRNKDEYQRADRSYNDVWGPIEDYRDGYQQGFELGYDAGFDRRQFDSTIPSGFRRRGQTVAVTATTNSGADNANATVATPDATGAGGSFSIPRNTILALELLTPLSTDATQRGDRFQARVVEPTEYAGAIVEGRVTVVKRPGKTKGVAELQLSFEQIRTSDNRTAALHAELLEVVPMGRDEGVSVDAEGGVRGRDSTKDDVAKVGAATGVGAIIGAIAGGGKGAAIGAVIGGGAGTAGVMTQRGKDIRLERGQQLKIRTSSDTGVL